MTTLLSLCDLIVDCEHRTAPTTTSGYPLIRTPDIGVGRLYVDSAQRIDEATYRSWTKRAVPRKGDLILAREAPVGNVGIVRAGVHPALGQRTVLIRPRPDVLDPYYLNYLLSGPDLRGWMDGVSSGATVPHLNMADIRAMVLPPLPSIGTQRKIGAILSAYDDLIENNNRRIKVLQEMAQRIYREWFVDFRYPGHQGIELVDSASGQIPKRWQSVTLGDIAIVSWGDTSTTKAKYVDAGFAAYSASGMDGFLPYFDHDHNGVVLSAIGANCGRTWFASGKWSCIKNTIWFRPRIATMPTEYLYFATRMPDFWPRRGSAQPFIALGDALGVRLVLPPTDLLTVFGDTVSLMVRAFTTLQAASENLRASRDLLLPRLISGDADVTNLDISMPELSA